MLTICKKQDTNTYCQSCSIWVYESWGVPGEGEGGTPVYLKTILHTIYTISTKTSGCWLVIVPPLQSCNQTNFFAG